MSTRHKKDSAYAKLKSALATLVGADLANWPEDPKDPVTYPYGKAKDATYFSIWKEKFKLTAESQGIGQLLDPEYVATNPELDEIQSKWMYKGLEDMCIERSAHAIVLEYKGKSHNVRGLWKALCDKFSKATETDLKIQRLTAYIVGANFSNSNWRGTQTNMILHYKKQIRLYHEELAPTSEHCTDVQLNRFLNQAVMGVCWFTTSKETLDHGTNNSL